MKVSTSGGTPTLLAYLTGYGSCVGCRLALDNEYIYWTAPVSEYTRGRLKKMPLTGGSPVDLATDLYNPQELTVDGTSIYWVNRGTLDATYTDGSVMKLTPK
jgi:hypothetical protein